MLILEKFTKQPADVQDYDISFVEYLAALSDTAASYTATVASGITMITSARIGGVIKVWLSGGLDGQAYKITVTLTTTGGRVKQAEVIIKVREV